MNAPQFQSNAQLTVKAGFSRLVKECEFRSYGVQATHDGFQQLRNMLRLSGGRVLYVAWRQAQKGRGWMLGRYRKDRLGRVRFYQGWPGINGLTQITAKEVFK
jgi:hypothetical protein